MHRIKISPVSENIFRHWERWGSPEWGITEPKMMETFIQIRWFQWYLYCHRSYCAVETGQILGPSIESDIICEGFKELLIRDSNLCPAQLDYCKYFSRGASVDLHCCDQSCFQSTKRQIPNITGTRKRTNELWHICLWSNIWKEVHPKSILIELWNRYLFASVVCCQFFRQWEHVILVNYDCTLAVSKLR